MQNHRPENDENTNGKTSLLFSTLSSLEKVLAIPGGCSNPPEVLNNPTKHQNISQHPSGSSLSKSTRRRHQRAPGRHRHDWEASHIPTHCSETDLDLPVGTKLLPKLTAEGYLSVFWTLNPGKVGSLHHLHCSALSHGIVHAGVLWSMQSIFSKHYSQPS